MARSQSKWIEHVLSETRPFFSVITPSYRGQKFYSTYFCSLAQQSFKDFEIIICLRPEHVGEDGECEKIKILEVFRLHGLKSRLKIIVDLSELGLAHQRNILLKNASGKYFAMFDIDDHWYPRRLERLYEIILNQPDIQFLHHPMEFIDAENINRKVYALHAHTPRDLKELLLGPDFQTSSVVFKREVFEIHGGFDEYYIHNDDFAYWLHLLNCEIDITYLPEVWGQYLVRLDSTHSRSEAIIPFHERAFLKYQKLLHKTTIIERLKLGKRRAAFYYTAALKNLHQGNMSLSYTRLCQAWALNPFNLRYPLQILLNYWGLEFWDFKPMTTKTLPRIVCILPSLKMGGAERVFSSFLKHCDPHLAEWHLFLIHKREDEVYSIPEHVRIHELKCTRLMAALFSLAIKLRRFQPDVVFSTLTHVNIGLLLSRFMFPGKVWIRESSFLNKNIYDEPHPYLTKKLLKATYPMADGIITLGDSMKRELIDTFGISKTQIEVLYNPVILPDSDIETNPFIGFNSAKNIIVVGRLDPVKQGELAIAALSRWIISEPNIHLWFCGDGPCLDPWKAYAHQNNIEDHVHFPGKIENLSPWYRHADLLLHTPKWEGLPNVLIEAIAHACPIHVLTHEGCSFELLESVGLEHRWVQHLDNPLWDRTGTETAAKKIIELCDPRRYSDTLTQLLLAKSSCL